jgi:hypothetical protein
MTSKRERASHTLLSSARNKPFGPLALTVVLRDLAAHLRNTGLSGPAAEGRGNGLPERGRKASHRGRDFYAHGHLD